MAYQAFTSPRLTEPDPTSLFNTLRGLDATAGVQHTPGSGTWTIKKNSEWTAPQITAAQNAIDTAPATSPELTAQANIDAWAIELKAIVLAQLDENNRLRAALGMPQITPAQVLAAVRAKAGSL